MSLWAQTRLVGGVLVSPYLELAVAVGGLEVGAIAGAIYPRVANSAVDLGLTYTTEILATAIGISLIDEASALASAARIALAIGVGALLVTALNSYSPRRGEHEAYRLGATLRLSAASTVMINGPEFVALGIALPLGTIGLLLAIAVCLSNIVQGYSWSVGLVRSGHRYYLPQYWLLVGLALSCVCLLSYEYLSQLSSTYDATLIGLAAGGMQVAQSTDEPDRTFTRGILGAFAASRFAIAFFLGAALKH